ncbi:MAG: DUF5106 domain-containing protein [Bacteroidales bacterium]|nr:DUF5106 domain-containing protein [Bacteroidales bacterium]
MSLRALNYWDKYDLSDSTLYRPVAGEDSFSAMESEASNFFALLKNVPDSVARIAVGNYLDKAALASRDGFDAYGQILGIAEKYFYNVNSPYYCEEMLLPFLDHMIARADIPEVEKSREKYLAMLIRRNAVGSKAEDFVFNLIHLPEQLIFTDGDTHEPVSLYEIVDIEETLISKPLLIVFYSADCRDCLDGIDRLSHSPVVRERVSSGKMNVLVVCVEGNCRSSVSKMPKDWIVAEDISEEYHKNIVETSLYSVRQTPSVYMLDEKGVVLLKDASVSSAIQFLLEQ